MDSRKVQYSVGQSLSTHARRRPHRIGGVDDRGAGTAGRIADHRPRGRLGDDHSRRLGAGDPGTPPHRHSGPAFGYVLEGAVRFELEGEPERIIEAGETFWEPGGDAIHYQDGNALPDARTQFVVTMMCAPGRPMLELVDEKELAERAHLRAPRPDA